MMWQILIIVNFLKNIKLMSVNTRIISRLDIKGPNLIKGVHLEGLRVIGDPNIYAQKYYEQGVDEIIYMDTVASLYGRNNLHDIVKNIFRCICPYYCWWRD